MRLKDIALTGLVAGLVLIASEFISSLLLAVDYSESPSLWKPVTNVWWYQIIAISLVEGLIFSFVYTIFYKNLPGDKLKKGLSFGFLAWLIGTLPAMLTIFIAMAVPNVVIFSWAVGALVNFLLMGCVVSVIYEKIKSRFF